jgi:hypothetical protein
MNGILETAQKKADSIRSLVITVSAILALLGTVLGGYTYIDDRYALAETVDKLEERLTLSELKDSLRLALDELFFLKSQARKYPDDEEIKDQLKAVQERVDDLKRQIEALTK